MTVGGILTAGQQVKEVAQPRGVALENLGISALRARHDNEFLVLNIKKSGILASGAYLLGFVLGIVALGAGKGGSDASQGQPSRMLIQKLMSVEPA